MNLPLAAGNHACEEGAGQLVVGTPVGRVAEAVPFTRHDDQFHVAAGNAQGLRDMKFTEGVEYREPGAKGQQGRVVKATTLEAVLDPAAGTLHNAHFMGSVDFTDSPMHASRRPSRNTTVILPADWTSHRVEWFDET